MVNVTERQERRVAQTNREELLTGLSTEFVDTTNIHCFSSGYGDIRIHCSFCWLFFLVIPNAGSMMFC